jgi:hypothetical protein
MVFRLGPAPMLSWATYNVKVGREQATAASSRRCIGFSSAGYPASSILGPISVLRFLLV